MTFWYSTESYKPATSGTFIVYQKSTGFTFIADCEHFNDGDFRFSNESSDDYLDDISHFADIPAIPLDGEPVISNPTFINTAPKSLPQMQDVYIEDLNLGQRIKRCLLAENIITLKDLSKKTIRDLTVIPNLGKLSLTEIVNELKTYSIRLDRC